MARPAKKGLDYFPMDVYNDDKLKLLIAEFGMIGFGVVISLFQRIYAEEGYYTVLNEDVVKLFAFEKKSSDSTVSEIIKAACRIGIFDKSIYEKYEVLTSKGIQKRYIEATSRRNENCIDSKYILLNVPVSEISDNNNQVSANNNSVNVNNNTQSKVNKNKGNKKKENKDSSELMNRFDSFYMSYPKKVAKTVALKAFTKLNPNNELLQQMLSALEQQKKNWKDPQFIPNPSSWINQKRWEDEVNGKNQSRINSTGKDRFGNKVY